MSNKFNKRQFILSVVDLLFFPEEKRHKVCRNCNILYVPLDTDKDNISVCMRCNYPNLQPMEYINIKHKGGKQ